MKRILLAILPFVLLGFSMYSGTAHAVAVSPSHDCSITVNHGFNTLKITLSQCAMDHLSQGISQGVEVRYEETFNGFQLPGSSSTLNRGARNAVLNAVETHMDKFQSCPKGALEAADHGLNFWGELGNPSQFVLDNLPYSTFSECSSHVRELGKNSLQRMNSEGKHRFQNNP